MSASHDMKGAKRIEHLQSTGNTLRARFSSDILAKLVIDEIAVQRKTNNGFRKVSTPSGDTSVPVPIRRAYLVDSIKHPAELRLFQEVYGEMFWCVGVFAPEFVRLKRLTKTMSKSEAEKIMERDQGENLEEGQKVRKIFSESDYFIRNEHDTEKPLEDTVLRFLDIIFHGTIHTPNRHEAAMFKAASVAAKSGCMSRQVGAAIVSKSGDLLAVGWNDVPKFGGGLYEEPLKEKDFLDARCFKWKQGLCHNDERKANLIDNIIAKLLDKRVIKKGTDITPIRKALKETELSSIIEYSRSIHAEMEAIISVARNGGKSILDSILYTTTYPCHNCARHIVVSGIREVYYIEPYPKSLADSLHEDTISSDERNSATQVIFRQYEGVAPKNILKLFNSRIERKQSGKVILFDRKRQEPIYRPHLDSFTIYEAQIVKQLREMESKTSQP